MGARQAEDAVEAGAQGAAPAIWVSSLRMTSAGFDWLSPGAMNTAIRGSREGARTSPSAQAAQVAR